MRRRRGGRGRRSERTQARGGLGESNALKQNTSVAAVDEEADATEDVGKKRARITTKPADLELGSDPPQQLLGLTSQGTRSLQDKRNKRTAVFDAHLIVPPVLETHPHLGNTKRTTGI